MGNCIIIGKHINNECGICHSELGTQYVYCLYCRKRYHSPCMLKYKSICKGCPHCKQDYLRFIDKDRNKI